MNRKERPITRSELVKYLQAEIDCSLTSDEIASQYNHLTLASRGKNEGKIDAMSDVINILKKSQLSEVPDKVQKKLKQAYKEYATQDHDIFDRFYIKSKIESFCSVLEITGRADLANEVLRQNLKSKNVYRCTASTFQDYVTLADRKVVFTISNSAYEDIPDESLDRERDFATRAPHFRETLYGEITESLSQTFSDELPRLLGAQAINDKIYISAKNLEEAIKEITRDRLCPKIAAYTLPAEFQEFMIQSYIKPLAYNIASMFETMKLSEDFKNFSVADITRKEIWPM